MRDRTGFIFIHGLFNDVNSSHCIALNDTIITEKETEKKA